MNYDRIWKAKELLQKIAADLNDSGDELHADVVEFCANMLDDFYACAAELAAECDHERFYGGSDPYTDRERHLRDAEEKRRLG